MLNDDDPDGNAGLEDRILQAVNHDFVAAATLSSCNDLFACLIPCEGKEVML